MVQELVDWRLLRHRRSPKPVVSEASAFDCKLLRNSKHAILKHPGKQSPWANTVLQARVAGGELWRFSFAAEYCNVAYPAVSTGARNQLGDLLAQLFGEHAGQPGTDFRLRFEQDGEGWRAVVVGREDARVLPLVPRVKVRALPSLRVAAGWLAGAVTDEGLEELEEVELPGPIPDGCVAVRVSGESMAGWRSEIRDGDWLVLRPAAGVGFGAVEGEVVVLARGDAEARTFHVKRVVQGEDGRWWLRSDNSEVGAVEVVEGDEVLGVVVRVVYRAIDGQSDAV
jgi:SOS-response transcriptional repressor LexA